VLYLVSFSSHAFPKSGGCIAKPMTQGSGLKLVVTGAAGWLGRAVCAHAQAKGIAVIALDRAFGGGGPWNHALEADIGRDGVEVLGDDPRVAGADALIHCAGYAHRPIETPEEVARFFAINRDGTARVLALAKRAGIARVVYLSSIAFYDWAQGTDFDENGPLARPTAYAASKLDGERLWTDSGLDWRVARLGTVFGTGDRANFAKLAGALASRRFMLPGQGTARKSVLPVELAAELLVELSQLAAPPHRLLNLALPHMPTLAEICASYVEQCGFPPPKAVPLSLLRLMALAGDGVALIKKNFPLTSANVRKLTTSTTVQVKRMQQVFPERDWGDFRIWLGRSAKFYRQANDQT
jgi:UDP-glucose 4-epimerase